MDDTWRCYLCSFLLTTALLGNLVSAVDFEYISPQKSAALAEEFSNARFEDSDRKTLTQTTEWTCDMYGMRSKLQVQRGLKLYGFRKEAADSFKNTGAQPVESYRVDRGTLVGKTPRLQDRVRVTSNGTLISELSVVNTKPSKVIAYSVCR